MEQVIEIHKMIMETGGGSPVIYFLLGFLMIIGITGQWMLYYKCDLPGYACVVPIWNVVVFLKIMGRPAWQTLIVIIPPPLIAWGILFSGGSMVGYGVAASMAIIWGFYMAIVYKELCVCFGRTKTTDYIICLVLNGFYVLWLGLADSTEYFGTYPEAKKQLLSNQNQTQTA